MVADRCDEIGHGAVRITHPLMQEILGREPSSPQDAVRKLLSEDRDYVFPYYIKKGGIVLYVWCEKLTRIRLCQPSAANNPLRESCCHV